MTAATLLLSVVLSTSTALLYAYVGSITLQRQATDRSGRRALRLFALWWIGLALITFVGVVETGLTAAGAMDVATYRLLSSLTIVPLVAILWGLVSYLAYIYSGSARVFAPIAILHLGIAAYLFYVVRTLVPTSLTLGEWGLEVQYAETPSTGLSVALVGVLLLPALAAAIGYASLYFRTTDRSARYRIAMVSGAFLLWFGSSGIAGITPLGDWSLWPLASRVIALVSTLMVLAAYRPPRWVRERYGVRSTDESSPERTVQATWRAARATLIRLAA